MANPVSPIELQRHLTGVDYPAGKADLINQAKQQGAGDDILEVLQQIPDREYDGPNAVSAEVSQHTWLAPPQRRGSHSAPVGPASQDQLGRIR